MDVFIIQILFPAHFFLFIDEQNDLIHIYACGILYIVPINNDSN